MPAHGRPSRGTDVEEEKPLYTREPDEEPQVCVVGGGCTSHSLTTHHFRAVPSLSAASGSHEPNAVCLLLSVVFKDGF